VASLRAFRFATHLDALGWKVAVTHIRDRSQRLTKTEQDLLQPVVDWGFDVPVDRTSRKGSESDLGNTQQKTSDPNLALGSSIKETISTFTDWVDRATPVDTWAPLLLAQAPRLIRRGRDWGVDAVWSTANPWSSHLLAATVAKSLGVPWVADYRDPWTLADPYSQRTPQITQLVDGAVERWLLKQANAITYTAGATAERAIEHFELDNDRVHVFPNSYDSQLFETHNKVARHATEHTGTDDKTHYRKELLFFGRFRKTSSAKPLIYAVSEAKARSPEIVDQLVIRSAAELPPTDLSIAQSLGVDDVFETFEAVPYECAPARMKRADVLVICKPADRAEIIPAKLWDYLYARRPILGISDNPEVHEVVSDTQTGLVFPNSERHEIAEVLLDLASTDADPAEILSFDPVDEEIRAYDAHNVTSALSDLLRSLL
jgi:glycosyltransferase involved in cell wall biosynthesis